MARKVRTKKGRAVYARRKAIVEPVFGQIHTVQDGRRLLLRGEPAARAQWRFQCAIHNLLKVHRNGGLALSSPGSDRIRSDPAPRSRSHRPSPPLEAADQARRSPPPTRSAPINTPHDAPDPLATHAPRRLLKKSGSVRRV
jgi:Transposase DDE domain